MKGIWKSGLEQHIKDNAVYFIKNDLYSRNIYKGKKVRGNFAKVYGKLDDWNKARQYEKTRVKRANKAHLRAWIAKGDWDAEIKTTYGTKSVDWLVS